MKILLTIILLAGAGYGLYYFLNKENNFEVVDKLNVTTPSGMNENAPSVSTPPSYITIEGTIKNLSDKDFSGIFITYKCFTETLSVKIGNLKTGESNNFKSQTVLVRDRNPEYKLLSITFDE